MKHIKPLLASCAAYILCGTVQAGTCEIFTTRTACPGQQAVSYKKCNGEQSCSEFIEVNTSAECKSEATKACENKRFDITKSKIITAKFEKVALKNDAGGEDFCETYANRKKEFDQCGK